MVHKFVRVHREMMIQIALDYGSLPDVRTLSASDIRLFYDGIRGTLHKRTKPSPKK